MFYVYVLTDPRDGKAFYVGKGSGRRIKQHVKDARSGKPGRKCDRIREIIASGLLPAETVVREFDDEAGALGYEARLIKKIGLSNLTNVMAGGGYARPGKSAPKIADRLTVFAHLVRIAATAKPRGPWAKALMRALERRLPQLGASVVGDFGEPAVVAALRSNGVLIENRA